MKFNGMDKEFQKRLVDMIESAEDKSKAIVEVAEKIIEKRDEALIEQLVAESEASKGQASYYEKMGYRTNFTTNEKAFYDTICKQSITADQIDIIPTEIIDMTLADIREQSQTLKLVKFAPAGVKKWLRGSYTGKAAWGTLTSAIATTNEIQATIKAMDMEVFKMFCPLIIPKAVRDLAMPFVDKYFTAVLNEVMHDGAVEGFLHGNGTSAPIGIDHKLPTESGTIAAKSNTTVTGFTPDKLAEVLCTLSNGGKRAISKIYVIANPLDVFRYVNPALRFFNGNGYVSVADIDIEVIQEPVCKATEFTTQGAVKSGGDGEAFITIDKAYTMGFSGTKVNDYKEVKAMDDADAVIAKVYGNGAPDDDVTAIKFKVNELVKFVPHVINEAAGA